MTEEELSNFDMELIPSQTDYLIKFQNLQTKFFEEKENSLNLEKKVFYLENKEANELSNKKVADLTNEMEQFKNIQSLKEFNEKIKEIENKNVFLENKLKEKKEKIKKIKSDNQQKDEKINLLEKANDLFNKRIAELTIELEKLKNIQSLSFIKINNKWKIDIDNYKCCENKCINLDKPIVECIEGNGFINLINDENVNYIKCVEGKGVNKYSLIYTENSFKKPQNCINYSLFYFEIKCTTRIGGKLDNDTEMVIGLELEAANKGCIRFGSKIKYGALIVNENDKKFKIPMFSWNDNDVFGCGLVYPPEDVPYIFFTQNGKQIGKAVLLKDNCESFKPYIAINCCSVETNFGNNLETKPFIYDFSKHLFDKY
uniref:SPRY domain-containing protein n=1 Tax=Meloidogyne incognita TaxID=6306 RepID=A0A914KZ98_MELIC